MRLTEYEQLIKKQITQDRNNPEIYNNLQKMIYMFLRRKQVGKSPEEVEEVSYTFAGDIYMKILSGDEIEYYLGYLERKHKEYFREYYRMSRFNEPYDPTYDDSKVQEVQDYRDYENRALNKVYLQNVDRIIDKLLRNSKYKYNSKSYINLKLSLALSLLNDRIVVFHLSKEEEEYLKFLTILFYNEIKEIL